MPDKPSYLGLLNAVSLAETRAHAYLSAWADTTSDPEVRAVLLKVAAREGEHGMSFAKRINELGFQLECTEDPHFEEQMAIATADCSDLEKAEALNLLRFCTADGEPDIFDGFFRDHSIDIRTGELLGRYIAEERDTMRLFQACHAQLSAQAAGAAPADGARLENRLATLEDKIDTVCRAVEELREIVSAQAVTGPAKTNGAGAKQKARA
jgi:rubrerythrin